MNARTGFARPIAAALAAGACLVCSGVAVAAFEWTHATPRSWVIGLDDSRWTEAPPQPRRPGARASGRGDRRASGATRVAVIRSRPWDWPDLAAVAVRGGYRRSGWSLALGAGQLTAGEYRETRWSAALGLRTTAADWLGLSWSGLGLRGAGRARSGHEVSLAWARRGGRWRARVVALGAWRSAGAARLGPPPALIGALGLRAPPFEIEAEWRETAEVASGRLGVEIETGGLIVWRAAIASREPRLRWGIGARRDRRLGLDITWLLHGELPLTHVIGLRWGGGP